MRHPCVGTGALRTMPLWPTDVAIIIIWVQTPSPSLVAVHTSTSWRRNLIRNDNKYKVKETSYPQNTKTILLALLKCVLPSTSPSSHAAHTSIQGWNTHRAGSVVDSVSLLCWTRCNFLVYCHSSSSTHIEFTSPKWTIFSLLPIPLQMVIPSLPWATFIT